MSEQARDDRTKSRSAGAERVLDRTRSRAASAARERAPARVFIKICGITSCEDAALAVGAGADAIGLVFWPRSPRRVDLAAARRIAASLPPFVVRVGVFVNAARDELARASDEVGLDVLQLHGDEPPESVEGLPRRVLKALRVGDGFEPATALRYEGRVGGILLDAGTPQAPGGTGRSFDWSLARGVREGARFLVLAGGLRADNVASAIAAVRPDGVDVSSGVESVPGRKDAQRLRAFVAAARGAAA
jgi:phosphoribosylanthranilate isomerase